MRTDWSLLAILAAWIAAVILGLWLFGSGPTEEEIHLRQYCAMVALNKKEPELGWPDYDKAFDKQCNEDGTVKEDQ